MPKGIIELSGGLGNQISQYVYGLYLIQKKDMRIYHDTRFYDGPFAPHVTPRTLDIAHFPKCRIQSYPKKYYQSPSKVKRALRKLLLNDTFNRCSIKDYHDSTKPGENVYLNGAWTSFKYAKQISCLNQWFMPDSSEYSGTYKKYLDLINQSNNAIAIHIRRGDYVNNPHVAQHHDTLPEAYYIEAIRLLRSKLSKISIFYFSDDTDWVTARLPQDPWTHIIKTESQFEDFDLMRHCRHMVTANSTFSWWGALLNKQQHTKKNIVVSPLNWHRKSSRLYDHNPEIWFLLDPWNN